MTANRKTLPTKPLEIELPYRGEAVAVSTETDRVIYHLHRSVEEMEESIAFLDELGVGSLVETLGAAAEEIEGVADILCVLAGHERRFEAGWFKSETVRAKRPPRSVATPNKAAQSRLTA